MLPRHDFLADNLEAGLSDEIICQRLIRLANGGKPAANPPLAANDAPSDEHRLPSILFLHNMGDLDWLSTLAQKQ